MIQENCLPTQAELNTLIDQLQNHFPSKLLIQLIGILYQRYKYYLQQTICSAQTLQAALTKLRTAQDDPSIFEGKPPFSRLTAINPDRVQLLLSPPGLQARKTLTNFYQLPTPSYKQITLTVLQVNEYIHSQQNELLKEELQQVKAANSINREEYAFAGKRKKVLVLKKEKKQRAKPFF